MLPAYNIDSLLIPQAVLRHPVASTIVHRHSVLTGQQLLLGM